MTWKKVKRAAVLNSQKYVYLGARIVRNGIQVLVHIIPRSKPKPMDSWMKVPNRHNGVPKSSRTYLDGMNMFEIRHHKQSD